MDELLIEIDAFRQQHRLSEWQFGEFAVRDRKLLPQLRAGREPRRKTVGRIRTFMADYRAQAA